MRVLRIVQFAIAMFSRDVCPLACSEMHRFQWPCAMWHFRPREMARLRGAADRVRASREETRLT